jgi:ankyrin repeat protein
LNCAVERGHTEIANSLIAAGATIDVEDIRQRTALIYAAEEGHTDIANSLITAGASMDAKDF